MKKTITPEQKEGNQLIAIFMGFTLYKNCKAPSWFYECENYKWEELNECDIWVKGATYLFKFSPCVSNYYWEIEKNIDDNQWEIWEYESGINYHENWNKLIPVIKKVMKELWGNDKIKHPKTNVYNTLRGSLSELEIKEVFEVVVEGIKLLNETNEQTTTEVK